MHECDTIVVRFARKCMYYTEIGKKKKIGMIDIVLFYSLLNSMHKNI